MGKLRETEEAVEEVVEEAVTEPGPLFEKTPNQAGADDEITSRRKVEIIVEAADDKRAEDIVTLDLQGLTLVSDFFVICSGRSDVHIRAITDGIEETLKKQYGIRPYAVQGRREATWVILDYGDVVVHIFSPAEREYYDLESFWKHARVVERVLAGRPDGHPAARANALSEPSAAADRDDEGP